jgi:hypothetical protein
MSYPIAGYEAGGGGGDFHVVRALAVGGQLLRVVFSAEPMRASTAGLNDSRNASNYEVQITSGTGHALQSIAVKPDMIVAPAFGVDTGEYACDLQLDRPMVVGMSYSVTVSTSVSSKDGHFLGWPYAATCVGAARPKRTRQIRRKIGLVDLASDPFTGGIMVDSSGDWASHEGLPGTRKRVWRCVLTGKAKFSWLQNLGLKYDIKLPGTISVLGNLRTDIRQQLAQQPDIKASQSGASMDSQGFLSISVKAQTASGEVFGDTVRFGPEGMMLTP